MDKDKYEAVCPKKTGKFAKGTRNGTDKCNQEKQNKENFFKWFKNPKTNKGAVDAGWKERNKKETWYKNAYLHAFGSDISERIQSVIESEMKKEEKDTDVNFI